MNKLFRVFHKYINYYGLYDWELPNSQICLAEINIESGLDFPI